MTGMLTDLGTVGAVAAEPLGMLAGAMSGIASAAEGTKKTQEAFGAFVGSVNESKAAIESATENLSKLAGAAYSIEGGFKKALEGGQKFVGSLDPVNSGVERTIELMNDLKEAAEAAFKASQTASGAGSGGSADISAQREGGYAGDRLASQMVSLDAFNSAPAFAEGTANTSRYLSRVSGGGIPSILHPNEAVVPLSRGRSIPVDLSFAMQPSASMDVDLSPLSKMAESIGDLAASLSRSYAMPTITVDVTPPAIVAPLIPPQARNTDGLGLGASGDRAQRDVRRGDERRDAGGGATTINIGDVVIKADDVDSFNRSKDQVRRQLSAEISKANRRARR